MSLLRRAAGWVTPLAFAALALVWTTATSPEFAVASGAVIAAVLIASIAIHEAGHAIAAWLVGLRVVRVTTGSGPRLLHLRVGRCDIDLRLWPTGGRTHLAARNAGEPPAGFRVRHLVAVAAGPAATIALAAFGTTIVPAAWGIETVNAVGRPVELSAGAVMVYLNVILAVGNLLPLGPTDGSIMWWLLTTTDDQIEEMGDVLTAAEADLHTMSGDAARALEVTDGLDISTASSAAIAARGAALLSVGRFAEGRQILAPLLEQNVPDPRRAIIANNLAWANLHLGDPALVVEAEQLSAEALAILAPDRHASLLNTRARALAHLGRSDEAAPLIDEAIPQEPAGPNLGEMLATRALVLLGRHDALGARRDADAALRHAPDSVGVRHIRSIVDQRSLDLVRAQIEMGPDGPTLPAALRSREGAATCRGASRALGPDPTADDARVRDALATVLGQPSV